jgi:methylisocitrate lyase
MQSMAITITLGPNGHYHVNDGSGYEHDTSASFLPVSGSTKLRRMLHETNELIVCPGVYDGLSARVAMQLDFKAMYMVCPHLYYETG